jgi:hypothetical protein
VEKKSIFSESSLALACERMKVASERGLLEEEEEGSLVYRMIGRIGVWAR